jgi:hypothetical protein
MHSASGRNRPLATKVRKRVSVAPRPDRVSLVGEDDVVGPLELVDGGVGESGPEAVHGSQGAGRDGHGVGVERGWFGWSRVPVVGVESPCAVSRGAGRAAAVAERCSVEAHVAEDSGGGP